MRSTSPPKSAWPGVSTMLIRVSSPVVGCSHSTDVHLARMVIPRSFSRSFESIARSSTRWLSRNVPDWRNNWSTSVVLPWSTWAMIAILRRALDIKKAFAKGRRCWAGVLWGLAQAVPEMREWAARAFAHPRRECPVGRAHSVFCALRQAVVLMETGKCCGRKVLWPEMLAVCAQPWPISPGYCVLTRMIGEFREWNG